MSLSKQEVIFITERIFLRAQIKVYHLSDISDNPFTSFRAIMSYAKLPSLEFFSVKGIGAKYVCCVELSYACPSQLYFLWNVQELPPCKWFGFLMDLMCAYSSIQSSYYIHI